MQVTPADQKMPNWPNKIYSDWYAWCCVTSSIVCKQHIWTSVCSPQV